jgi:hypothetical protein
VVGETGKELISKSLAQNKLSDFSEL